MNARRLLPLAIAALAVVAGTAGSARAAAPPAQAFAAPVDDGLARATTAGRFTPAQAALLRAQALFHPLAAQRSAGVSIRRADPRGATLILRDLGASLDELGPTQRRVAERILARPSDGGSDPLGNGWTGAEAGTSPACDANVCVHWTATGGDAPDLTDNDANGVPDWVDQTLSVMGDVWTEEVGTLGYRAPKSDMNSTNNGGSGKLDVYLANIGPSLYGYCTSDDPHNTSPSYQFYDASAYCVLDDDYSTNQFPDPPLVSLDVTAAHEFFHAVQFAYDYFEDSWLMEGTATWIEGVAYPAIHQHIAYLSLSPLTHPTVSLDSFASSHYYWYGSWLWFQFVTEWLSTNGTPVNDAIRGIWQRADGASGGTDNYSMQAVRNEITARSGVGLTYAFADFAMWNRYKQWYQDGAAYPSAAAAKVYTLGPGHTSTGWLVTHLNHLAALPATIRPAANGSTGAHLTISFDLPNTMYGSAARVLVRTQSGVVAHRLALSSGGNGSLRVNFGRGTVTAVTVVTVNGSSRYSCWQSTQWSCTGVPLDQGRTYQLRATLS